MSGFHRDVEIFNLLGCYAATCGKEDVCCYRGMRLELEGLRSTGNCDGGQRGDLAGTIGTIGGTRRRDSHLRCATRYARAAT